MQTFSFSRIKGKVPYNLFWRFVYFFELHVIFSFSSWNVQDNNRFRSNRHSRVQMCPMAPCAICGYPRDRGTARGLFFFTWEFCVSPIVMLLPFTYSHTKPQSERAYFTAIKCIGPYTDQNDNFPSLPYPTLVKSQQFHVHQAVKRVTLFWAEPPVWGIIGSTPPPNTHSLPTSRCHCLCYSLL